MSHTTPPIDTIQDELSQLKQEQKLKILVVDDEPDNLDLLYRTFRREFRVLRAQSGTEALDILSAEGEVAIIISDQRMPEMKGTEFLSKTVPQFPNTVRIILTGFTDVEDLVDAINSGQVYKYITKPWNPLQLKDVVISAAATYQLLKQQADEVRRAQRQTWMLNHILEELASDKPLPTLLDNLAAVIRGGFSASICLLQLLENGAFSPIRGLSQAEAFINQPDLSTEPLIQRAIATASIQLAPTLQAHELESDPYYTHTSIASHLVIPMLRHQQVFAILSLQWPVSLQDIGIDKDDVILIHTVANQLSVSLSCIYPLGSGL